MFPADTRPGDRQFRDLATDTLAIYTTFLEAVEAAAPPLDDEFRIPDAKSEPEAWATRTHRAAARILRAAQQDAANKIASSRYLHPAS